MAVLKTSHWRLKVVVVAAVLALGVGVTAAFGALGAHDTATGTGALASEATGNDNTADGYNALNANTSGNRNTAVGAQALEVADSSFNSAFGRQALSKDTSGSGNTAIGEESLRENLTGIDNTAVGGGALIFQTAGDDNAALGLNAGESNGTGSNNTFLGSGADTLSPALSNATAVGSGAAVDQSNSLVLGASGVDVGINTSTPKSRLQVGSGLTASFGEYLQLPVVVSALKRPLASDCDTGNLVGRLVLLSNGKKVSLWACSPTGVWVKV
jgi:hypothetical protein